MNSLQLLKINLLVNTNIQHITPLIQNILLVLTDIGYTMSTFWKCQKEVLAGFREKNWLGIRISKSRPQNLIRQKL